jgi:hypothetical protein
MKFFRNLIIVRGSADGLATLCAGSSLSNVSIPKSKPWKTSNLALRYLGCLSTDRIIVRKILYAAFRNENLSIILVNILLVKIVLQKYNNPLNLYLLLYINMLKE